MADKRRRDAICTVTGTAVRPLDPRPDDINIEDIAHSLANQCRFTGHTATFYSVAQHSVHVSQLCENYPLEGLLHDASEAYLSDIARPIKKAPGDFGKIYNEIELGLTEAIADAFNLEMLELFNNEVKAADDTMLGAEARDLMPPVFMEFGMGKYDSSGWPDQIVPWHPEWAKTEFLQRYKDLTKETV